MKVEVPAGRKGYLSRNPPFLHRPDFLVMKPDVFVDVRKELLAEGQCEGECRIRPHLWCFENLLGCY